MALALTPNPVKTHNITCVGDAPCTCWPLNHAQVSLGDAANADQSCTRATTDTTAG